MQLFFDDWRAVDEVHSSTALSVRPGTVCHGQVRLSQVNLWLCKNQVAHILCVGIDYPRRSLELSVENGALCVARQIFAHGCIRCWASAASAPDRQKCLCLGTVLVVAFKCLTRSPLSRRLECRVRTGLTSCFEYHEKE